MIITCPQCSTKYQVADQAIGSAGRKVQCAHCALAWHATADAPLVEFDAGPRTTIGRADNASSARALAAYPVVFDEEADEDALDHAFVAEEQVALAVEVPLPQRPAPEVDTAVLRKRQKDMAQRQRNFYSSLPMVRMRRAGRLVAFCVFLTLIGGAYQFRTELVRAVPDLAGLYAAVGLPVNVVGLDFFEVKTIKAFRDGTEIMVVTARLSNSAGQQVAVPPVLVTLLDAAGAAIYEWSALPPARIMGPDDTVSFEARLASPPSGIGKVRLSFALTGTAEGA